MSSDVRWWNRLGFRLTVIIVLVTLSSVSLFVYLVLRTQRSHLERQTTEAAAMLSDTIKSSTHQDMLLDRRADAYLVMETIGRQERIDRVRIFNKEGRITYSTDRAETGQFVDTRAESCHACHAADKPIERLNLPSRSRTFVHEGHRELGMVTPVYNEPSCYEAACHAHPREKRVLGVIDIAISLEDVDAEIASLERATLGIGALSVLLVAGLVTLFTRRSLVRPVLRLVEATKRIGSGNLKEQVPVGTRSELGQLERSFNEMAHSLAQMRAERLKLLNSLEQQVEDRTAELKAAQDRLVQSEKLSSLGRLAASIAHEINNPLAGILTYAKLIIRTLEERQADAATAQSAIKQLKLVQKETERCTAIVRNLLDFARERPLTLVELDLAAVVDEALVLVSNQARLSNIELVKDLAPGSIVRADSGQLRQAFINIIINACDAMSSGGGQLRITARPDHKAGTVDLSFQDTGCGIPPEHMAKVLDPFFTTKERGTGLGLSVVYGIVERHGGKVEIASEVNKGTTVRIRLPIASPDGRMGAPAPRAAALPGVAPSGGAAPRADGG